MYLFSQSQHIFKAILACPEILCYPGSFPFGEEFGDSEIVGVIQITSASDTPFFFRSPRPVQITLEPVLTRKDEL